MALTSDNALLNQFKNTNDFSRISGLHMYVRCAKQGRSLPELEQLEKDFRKALEGVCGERDRIVQEQLAKEEQRLCVVCQVNVNVSKDRCRPSHQTTKYSKIKMKKGKNKKKSDTWRYQGATFEKNTIVHISTHID